MGQVEVIKHEPNAIMPTHHEILEVAEQAARAAAQVLLKYFGNAAIHEKESTQNLVTQADFESEKLIAQMVQQAFPGHVMMQEETEFKGDILAEHLWIVDPLDATNNYAHGIPHFCVSIAYACRGEVQVGVVYDPMRDELFSAVQGAGAKLNGVAIAVSRPDRLQHCIISTGFYYERDLTMERTLDAIRSLFQANIRGIRRMGAAAIDLAWVACGRFQGFFEYKLAPWDYAAGALLVHEAGGVCRDRTGEPLQLSSGSMIASCATIHSEFTRIVVWPH